MARRFNRKPLTDTERDARRKADRERIEQAARALLSTDGWRRWIKVRASNGLSRYSLVISRRSVKSGDLAESALRGHVANASRTGWASAGPSRSVAGVEGVVDV